MSKKQDDREPSEDKNETAAVQADPKGRSDMDKLANAIESMVAANQAKSLPMFGMTPTDPSGKPIEPHGTFTDREGKEYDFIIDRVLFTPRAWVKGGEDPLSGKDAEFAHCYAFEGRANYKVKDADNWKPISAHYLKKDLRNNHKKAFITLPPDMEKHFTVTFKGDGKTVVKLDGVKY